ncbi:MAG: lantibiotic dehydratase [Micromonosporaceae bacterium]|nr:lantibiotic dehydratase [Micromonosporaceae bacterium]
MYQVLDAVLLRAATRRVDAALPGWPDLAPGTDPERWRDWLLRVWADESVVDAIAVASPVLAAGVARACADQVHDGRHLRRLVVSVARYLLRMTGRATPFGLFAGVTAAAIGAQPSLRWGQRHHPVLRADHAWVAGVATELEACPAVWTQLLVVANDLIELRDDRLVLACQHPGDDRMRSDRPPMAADVSIRATSAVLAVLTHTQSPITGGEVVDKLAVDFPTTTPAAAQAMLARLILLRVLLTELRAPMTTTDGLAHVRALLRAVGAPTSPAVAHTARMLDTVGEQIARHNRQPSAQERRSLRRMLLDRASHQSPEAAVPVTVDLRLDVDVRLPESLVPDARAAASVLTRLTPHPQGMAAWRDYHGAFLERYGAGALVPLNELVDPDTGLGFPATYRSSHRRITDASVTERDRRLLRLVQTTAAAGGQEIVLDEATITQIAGSEAAALAPPPHVELFAQIHAPDRDALRCGDYRLLVAGAARAAGATTGRFLDLLPAADRARFQAAYTQVRAHRAGAVAAQLVFPPLRSASEHAARAPIMLPHLVRAGTFPTGDTPAVGPDDLAVGGDLDGLYLVSLPDRRLIEPTAFNAVEFRHFSHPLARFLCEVPRALAAVYMPFTWGAASALAFLPRIRCGRVIVAPARWNLTTEDLPESGDGGQLWCEAAARWRRRWRVPDLVHLVEADNLLPLDLSEPAHLELLRIHLDRHGHARLDEAPSPQAFGWLDGHAHEIVIPLTATATPLPAPEVATVRVVRRDDGHLPGASSWLYAKLYTSPERHADLAARVPDLVAGCDSIVDWWYLPYRDPQPHLRLRLRLSDPNAFGTAAALLGAWASRLRGQRLLGRLELDTYQPETGRFGDGQAMAAAERVFATDSTAALAERVTATRATIPIDAVAAASLVDLAIAFTGDTTTGMRWLRDRLPHEPTTVDRTLHTAAVGLVTPQDGWARLHAVDADGALLRAWQDRRTALVDYRRQVDEHRSSDQVLASLLHLHHIRVHGIDPDRERLGRRLARAAALRWTATHPEATR